MIVTYHEEGWQVITQRAHGLVAAQLAFHWRLRDRPARWVETLLAIAEHDDAENELDGETLITDSGGPLNFDMKTFELPHCQKLAALTITKSRFIALLTSMHMIFLYEKDKPTIPGAKKFLEEQVALQNRWCKELQITKEESIRIYRLLEWCDALSLLICRGDLQPQQRQIEISTGPDSKVYHLVQSDDKTLSIQPWPFEVKDFLISFEYRLLSQLQFASSAAFRSAFLTAPVEEKTWRLQRGQSKKKSRT